MLKNMKCPVCNSEIVFRYHTPDKNFKITDGKIIRDDIHTGLYHDDSKLSFECSNGDRNHSIYGHSNFNDIDQWENTIIEEFYRGKYYDD